MKQLKLVLILLFSIAFLGVLSAQDQQKKDDGAKNNNQQQRRGGQDGRQRGNFNRGDWQKMVNDRMMQQYKTQVEVTDEEWAKLEPLVKDVMDKKAKVDGDAMGGLSRMFRGRTQRPEQPKEGEELSAEQKLRKALAENSPDPTIKDLLDEMRKEKEANLKALKDARNKLRLELSTKQEAQFVLNGLLD